MFKEFITKAIIDGQKMPNLKNKFKLAPNQPIILSEYSLFNFCIEISQIWTWNAKKTWI